MPKVLLALDAGNSKSDLAVVALAQGELLGLARGDGFRPHEERPEALAVIVELVTETLAEAGLKATDVVHLAAYMANADFPEEEERLEKALVDRGVAPSVTVGNDTFALLRSTATEGWGVAVVCGAGINCVGVAPDGRTARFPAIGSHTGDWGGGAELGRLALWHAVRDEDGRGPHTALTAAVAEYFGVAQAIDVGLAIHRGELDERRLWELAPVLLAAAEAGDAVAREVSDRLAEEVALLGSVALRRLGLLDRPTEVVLGGGVLAARSPVLMDEIRERYRALAPQARLLVSTTPPVLGAALLGLEQVGAPPETHQRLRAAFHQGH